MKKSSTEVMQSIIFSAMIDTITALKTASKGMPNALVRDLNAIHANIEITDLPKEVQDSIAATTKMAFNKLQHEGYTISQRELTRPHRNANPSHIPNRRGS